MRAATGFYRVLPSFDPILFRLIVRLLWIGDGRYWVFTGFFSVFLCFFLMCFFLAKKYKNIVHTVCIEHTVYIEHTVSIEHTISIEHRVYIEHTLSIEHTISIEDTVLIEHTRGHRVLNIY